MVSPREVLNELKWRRHALERARITYVHRAGGKRGRAARARQEAGADERTVSGSEVLDIGASFFGLASPGPMPTRIPYHRVLRIALDDGEVVWERRRRQP